ncbi:MAG TPA: cation-translocating P-type ATPase [Devosia sp.]|nr:cation-translocating P-type ATPase [Devosia sp.]
MPAEGLTSAQAASILQRDGPNTLPEPERRGPFRVVIEVLKEPMLVLLIVSGLIYLALGELSDALILVVFALFSVVVTIVQEVRTERVLQSLRDLTSPRALVVRDGRTTQIAGSDVVRGDTIVLREGDRVPADALVTGANDLQLDESLLTGESVPVEKRLASLATESGERPGPDGADQVFSGTMVVRGTGLGEVFATGAQSQIGRIGQSLNLVHAEPPRLQRETRRLTVVFGVIGVVVSGFAIILYGLLRDSWLNAALAGIALGMSMLPEEFPVVLAVFLAMGAWRISHARVLTRRASAIESLGSATVLCTDKTGTLTQNRMAIAEMRLPSGETWTEGQSDNLAPPWSNLLRTGVLASAKDPFDPMERAFHALALAAAQGIDNDWRIVRSYGLSSKLLAVVQAWESPERSALTIAAKGAPEAIATLCELKGEALGRLQASVEDMAQRGLRVLAVAAADHDGDWPDTPHGFRFTFLGLVGLADPLRPSVPEAVAQCHLAGIRIVMITGDHPETARAIANSAGLSAHIVHTGAELDAMEPAEFALAVRSCDVFARIRPEQKLGIVEALKRNGEVVAMTGDGVNDAPSLKAADIGIAMGGRGTDVAREASSIVLLDDDFGSIVAAIRLGRRIYDNLRKAMGFILAVHIPIAGLALLPLLTGLPVLFWPVHIAFLEMIIDPVCSLVFEAEGEEGDVMRRPPRPPNEPLLPMLTLLSNAGRGAAVLVVVGMVYLLGASAGLGEQVDRATTFVALVGSILGLVVTSRTFDISLVAQFARPNRALLVVVLLVIAVLGTALFVPQITGLFGFARLGLNQFLEAAAAVLACLGLLLLIKGIGRRLLGGNPASGRAPASESAKPLL